ncbi:MAG: hypothetical protein ABJO29_00320 [Yoonia sp.]|uniref:hypothetical protein n=1 Tax=Rhodobacterales TaxID=204455 RepID=UPI001FF2804D|nr:hypothetical protein [Loktanella sp. F6476L]MCK0122312.1 hypothetical protein [Loktanella sp. F6476L]
MKFRAVSSFFTAAAVAFSMVAAPVAAQDDPEFVLELNNAAETSAGGCRLTYVATNRTGVDLSQAAYEVAVFNGSGIVSRILVLAFGELPNGKTRIVQFDISDQPCADTSRIVVNDVAECTLAEDGATGDFCLSTLSTASRASLQFGL